MGEEGLDAKGVCKAWLGRAEPSGLQPLVCSIHIGATIRYYAQLISAGKM